MANKLGFSRSLSLLTGGDNHFFSPPFMFSLVFKSLRAWSDSKAIAPGFNPPWALALRSPHKPDSPAVCRGGVGYFFDLEKTNK
jgi:hypothetical protein